MPRRRSSSGTFPSSRSSRTRDRSNDPKKENHAPPPAPASAPVPAPVQGAMGTVASSIVDGLAISFGREIAHRIVDAIAGPRTIRHEHVAKEAASSTSSINTIDGADSCSMQIKTFQDCLNSNGTDIARCQFYMDMLAECKRNSGSAINA